MFDRIWERNSQLQASNEATIYLFQSLTYLGMNPPGKWSALYILYSAFINLSSMVFTPISFSLSLILQHHRMTMEKILTSLQCAINVWGLPGKVITIVFSVKRLRSCEGVTNILDARCKREDELLKIRKCAIMGNRWTIFFVSFYVVYSTSTFITSAIMQQPPYSIYMPFMDWQNSLGELSMQSFIEYMLMNMLCLHQATDDSYAVIYIYILRTHIQILLERVRRLGDDTKKSDDEHYEELIMCIKDHQNLLSLVDIVTPVISITIFVQFIITAAILGTTLINIFIFADTTAQVASVIYFVAVLVQTAPCCYQATCLRLDSGNLSLAIFHSNWFERDKRFRKMLVFFMLRAQNPITLTAMKLFPITLDTNISIAKFSFSLYTLIKGMDFGQNLK